MSNTNKINSIFFVVIFIAAEGIHILCKAFEKYKLVPVVVVGSIYFFCFSNFAFYYYGGDYREETGKLDLFDITVSEAIKYIDEDPILSQKETQMAESETFFALSTLRSPYILKIGERDEFYYENYHMSGLREIEDRCNYIVSSDFVDYSNELRARGFEEKCYEGYSLFYKR